MKNPSASELKQPPSRDAAIEAAALRLFVRHGFEKVRIGEIAAACGMSRPTLYAAFENKEAILSSIVRRHTRDLLASTTTALAGKPSLRAKLDYLFAAWIIDPYAIVIDADHASDLSTSAPKFAPQATAEMWGRDRAASRRRIARRIEAETRTGHFGTRPRFGDRSQRREAGHGGHRRIAARRAWPGVDGARPP